MTRDRHLTRLRSNIGRNYLFIGLTYVDVTRGLWMIWLTLRGFSLVQLGIMEGIFHLTSFLMEVPTGLVADVYGRRTSRALGRILFLGSLAMLYYSRSMTVQCLGFALTAIGYNLESGAGEALVYDSLKELGAEGTYKRITGINNVIFETGSIVSLVVGGYVAHNFGYEWVFLPGLGVTVLAALVAVTFEEPSLGHEERRRLRDMGWAAAVVEQARQSAAVVRENPRIAAVILFTELVMMFITSLFFYLQTHWKAAGWSEARIGLSLAFGSAASVVAGLAAHRTEKIIGIRGIVLTFPVLLILCLWGVGLTRFTAVFFALTGFVDGVLYVAMLDYLNKLIPSERRATILSFQSMAFSLYMIAFFPVIGLVGEKWGLKTAFIGMAAVASLLYGGYLILGARPAKGAEKAEDAEA